MNHKRTSKLLSLVLRHKPETINVELDSQGWIDIDVLLEALAANNHKISRDQLSEVVRENDKQRFAIEGNRIRANQGHSISVELGLREQPPPDVLYHGTATRFLDAILKEGLKRMNRQHVHLSADLTTASKVGVRHGKLVILEVDTHAMANDGHSFYISANGVWLTDHVPPDYLTELNSEE